TLWSPRPRDSAHAPRPRRRRLSLSDSFTPRQAGAPARRAGQSFPPRSCSAVLGRVERAFVLAELPHRFVGKRQLDQILVFRNLTLRNVADPLHQGAVRLDLFLSQP